MANYINGIDVSSIQGNINWQAVKKAGYQFVVIKCGNGNDGIDPNYKKNVAGAKAVGLRVMAYHFIYPLPSITPGDKRSPQWQAKYHFDACGGELAAIDCEWPEPKDFSHWGCSPAQINQWILDYLAAYSVLDNGRKPTIYTYPDWANNIKFSNEFTIYKLWIASYQNGAPYVPAPWDKDAWVMWQTTGGGEKLPGSGVPVDTDVVKDLSLWDNSSVVGVSSISTPVPSDPPATVPTPVVVNPPDTSINNPQPTTSNSITIFTQILNFIANIIKAIFTIDLEKS